MHIFCICACIKHTIQLNSCWRTRELYAEWWLMKCKRFYIHESLLMFREVYKSLVLCEDKQCRTAYNTLQLFQVRIKRIISGCLWVPSTACHVSHSDSTYQSCDEVGSGHLPCAPGWLLLVVWSRKLCPPCHMHRLPLGWTTGATPTEPSRWQCSYLLDQACKPGTNCKVPLRSVRYRDGWSRIMNATLHASTMMEGS